MDYEAVYMIDMAPYGEPGKSITVSAPTFRRKVEAKNARTQAARLTKDGDSVAVTDLGAADQELITMLAYIEAAPFQRTLKGFLGYMDRLDAIKKGNADELYDELTRTIKAIVEGDGGPFAGSQGAESGSSE